MMSEARTNSMREARRNVHVNLLKYNKIRSQLNGILICVFEGHDDTTFYGSLFKKVAPEKVYTGFNCNGKDQVLALRDKLRENVERCENEKLCPVVFFIDKDFDGYKNYQPGNDLYCTPTYSIENLLVGKDVLKELLKGEFHCNDEYALDEIKKIIQLYEKSWAAFIEAFRHVNHLIYYARKNNIRLNNIEKNINSYITVKIDRVKLKCDRISLSKLVGLSSPPDDLLLNETLNDFLRLDPATEWRGKFIFEFFRKFLCILKEDAGSKTPIYFTRRKNIRFNPTGDIIRTLASIINPPPCLVKFISHWK